MEGHPDNVAPCIFGGLNASSKLDTAKLKNHPDSNWIQHREGWEKKVEEIINRDATPEEKEEVRKYIKKKKGK